MKEKKTKKTEACKNDTAEQKRAEMQLHGSERRPQASKTTITRQQSSKSKKTPKIANISGSSGSGQPALAPSERGDQIAYSWISHNLKIALTLITFYINQLDKMLYNI